MNGFKEGGNETKIFSFHPGSFWNQIPPTLCVVGLASRERWEKMTPKVIRLPKDLKASEARAKSVMGQLFFVTLFVPTRETGWGLRSFRVRLDLSAYSIQSWWGCEGYIL